MWESSLISVTRNPRASSKQPIEDAARPLPKLETTPPVTKMYLGITRSLFKFLFRQRTCALITTTWRTSPPSKHSAFYLFTFSLPLRPLPADRRALLRRHRSHGASPVGLQLISLRPDPESPASPATLSPARPHVFAFETLPRPSHRTAW